MDPAQNSKFVSDLQMEGALGKHDIEGVVAAFRSDPFFESLEYYRWTVDERRVLFARLQDTCSGE